MALSKIWAAFIIVAILAATFQSVFIKGNSDMYSRMVIGKAGDTSQTQIADTSIMSAAILQTLQNGKTYTDGTTKYSKTRVVFTFLIKNFIAMALYQLQKQQLIFPSISLASWLYSWAL